MIKMRKETESFIIVRTCVGCILPIDAKLIGSGDYSMIKNGQKSEEPYYDYEIKEKYFDEFIEQNYIQLVNYKLIDEIESKKNKKEDNNPVKETTIRGYAREYIKKE